MNEITSHFIFPSGSRIWKPFHLGKDCEIGARVNIGALCHIGNNVEIGEGTRVQGSTYIADGCKIGKDCFIGPNVTITNDRHPPSQGKWSPVKIEDNVVIGGGSTLVAGITLSSGCIIGAGTVLTKSVASDEVWFGNPGKLKMTREEYETRRDENGS